MVWCRMLLVALRLAGVHLVTPWRSPLLRWRIETYGVLDERGRLLHADDIGLKQFFQFVIRHRAPLAQFLRWAACLS